MNVQFSLSASTIPHHSNPTTETVVSVDSMISETKEISTSRDLMNHQRQGNAMTVGQEQLIRNIERAVSALQGPQTTLDISIHEKTHEIMVKVMNKDTGELIREVPSEKMLDIVASMMEIAGILIDKKV